MRRTFWADTSGTFAIIFGLALVPLVGLVGLAIDYSRLSTVHGELRPACDAAALAIVKRMLQEPSAPTADLERTGTNWVGAHTFRNKTAPTVAVALNPVNDEVKITLTANVDRTLMRVVDPGTQGDTVQVSCNARIDPGSVEVALALDNSGSMSGNRIRELTTATKKFAEILFNASPKTKIALVPFAGLVNVGSQNRNEAWIDRNALVPYHSENLDSATRRFDVFASLGIPWGGCVEARLDSIDDQIADNDVTDAAPSGPRGLFVPAFAPDEPDLDISRNLTKPDELPRIRTMMASYFGVADGNNVGYQNNYLDDQGGTCQQERFEERDILPNGTIEDAVGKLEWRQKRACKYDGATKATNKPGPNWRCDSAPITPLTDNPTAINVAADAMRAVGGTNVAEGLAWAWRVLSPTAPFTQGSSDQDVRYGRARRIIVLMSDGESNIGTAPNHNLSTYSPYGYAFRQRIGTATTNGGDYTRRIDARLKMICDNVKGVKFDGKELYEIYTIGFDLPNQYARDVMSGCASSPANAKQVSTAAELQDVFVEIARRIGQIRISS